MRVIYRSLALAAFSFVLAQIPHLVETAPAPMVPLADKVGAIAQPAAELLQALKGLVDPAADPTAAPF